jgi:hypothetical protein
LEQADDRGSSHDGRLSTFRSGSRYGLRFGLVSCDVGVNGRARRNSLCARTECGKDLALCLQPIVQIVTVAAAALLEDLEGASCDGGVLTRIAHDDRSCGKRLLLTPIASWSWRFSSICHVLPP